MGQPYQTHWGREVVEKNREEKYGIREIEFQFSVLLRKVSMTPARIRETASRTSPIIQDLRESEFRNSECQKIIRYIFFSDTSTQKLHGAIYILYIYTHSVQKKETGRNNLFKTCKPTLTCPISSTSPAAIAPPAGTIAVLVPPALVTRRCEDSRIWAWVKTGVPIFNTWENIMFCSIFSRHIYIIYNIIFIIHNYIYI
jgi:hypothetical protein